MTLPPGRKGLPLVGETFGYLRNGYAFIDERLAAHGPVFRTRILGRPTAVIAGPDACAVWIDPRFILRAGSQPGFLFDLLAGPSLPHLDGDEHKNRKKLMLEGFTREALASYIPGLQRVAEAAAKGWSEAGEFTWIPELKRVAVEGIAANFLGMEPGPRMDSLVRDYDTATKGIGGIPVAFPGTAFRRALMARDRVLAVFENSIRDHRERLASPAAGGVKEADGLSRILCAALPDGTHITTDAMKRELHHIVIAGYIIFAEFAWMLAELHRHPDIRRRLEEEVRGRAASGPLTIDLLDNLPYLTQVVMEVKRLCPILPAIFGIARESFEFKGCTVPEGWMVLWAIRATLTDPAVYENPDTFDPDRFAAPRSEHLRHEHAFVPHGPGSAMGHQCPGTDYATYFIKTFAVALFRGRARWELVEPVFAYNWKLTPPEPADGLRARFMREQA